MNNPQIEAFVRTLLQMGAAVLVQKGIMDDSQATALSGALAAIVLVAWGVYARRNAALVAQAAKVPSVVAIVAEAAMAGAIKNDKVQAPASGGPVAAPAV